jgi:hypothetical protein
MASFVLVRGGGHGGWCYKRVARLLHSEARVVDRVGLMMFPDSKAIDYLGVANPTDLA